MRLPRPLEGSYGVTLLIAILAIAPYILVTTAYELYQKQLMADLGTDRAALAILAGLATAGYAFGALLGGDVIQRFPQRKLYFLCQAMFIVGCVVAATAGDLVQFGAGKVLLGFATGLLLVVSLPPVVQNFPAAKMPITASVVNIGFFGAVTAGPLIGGVVADAHAWRWFLAGLAAIGILAFSLALMTLKDTEPKNPQAAIDFTALVLGFFATVLPFWASGELAGPGFTSLLFMVPLAVGTACFIALLLTQYHKKKPLAPVKPMWKTVPVSGVLTAMLGGGALVTLMELLENLELRVTHTTPLATGLLFWPEVLGTLVATLALGALLRKAVLPLLPFAGMLILIAAAALLLFIVPNGPPQWILAETGLLGIGAGATVSPGLWLAAFALPASLVGQTFALVELVRSEADFIMAPVLLGIAQVASGSKTTLTTAGIHEGALITLLITIASTILIAAVYVAGNGGLRKPDLETWLDKDNKDGLGIDSPPLGSALH